MEGRYPFNVRVYGLLFKGSEEQLLISDERIQGRVLSKFPGGGLRFGEGPEDCIVRECREELGIEVQVRSHFYTTGFFQRSAFKGDEQVISIYYRIETSKVPSSELFHPRKEALPEEEGSERFRWVKLDELSPDDLELPIDRKVVEFILRARSARQAHQGDR